MPNCHIDPVQRMRQNRYMRKIILVLLLALTLAHPALAWETTAKAVRDGDSIDVMNADGVQVSIRLYGVDAPEHKQAYGYQAKNRLKQLVTGKIIRIENMDTDRYGRTVALVRLVDGTLINEEMARSGLAWVYDEYCKEPDLCADLRQAQAQARSAGRGLWAGSDPIPPWEWRKRNKTEEWYEKPLRAVKTLARKVRVAIHR